jgi:hypothetical protein
MIDARPAPAGGAIVVSRAAVVASYVYGLLVAAGLAHFLLGIPIQLTDSFGNMLKLEMPWGELLHGEFTQRAYLRPLLWADLKLVYDASGGNYFAWFRGVHVAQVFALVVLYVRLVKPRSWHDAALIPLGLAVLIGHHAVQGTVTEAFPVNTFMTLLLCCVAAANVAVAAPRWWNDVLAAVLLVVAALTVESGLIVWVIFTAAALAGARGVSRPGLALLAALLVGYFVLRFPVLQIGGPGLIERSSGYGFRVLDPAELVATFGANPLGFYVYNIVTSALSVLFAEPRAGTFRLTHGITQGDPNLALLINVIASTGGTVLIAAFVAGRWRAWRRREFDREDQLVVVFVAVLAANAVISYPYTKDSIMTPAGLFFAVAVYVAGREVLPRWVQHRRTPVMAGALVLCLTLASTWAIRAIGIHLKLRTTADSVRREWIDAEDRLSREGARLDDRSRALLQHLRFDAVYARPVPAHLRVAGLSVFDEE